MFGKKNDAVAPSLPRPSESALDKNEQKATSTITRCTVIAAHTVVTGDLMVKGDCQVFGCVQGTFNLTEGVLRVMKEGRIEGDINAPTVVIDGWVTGACEATSVEILENGTLNGVCRSGHLSITLGGIFLGQSERLNGDANLPTPVVDIGSHQTPSTRKKVIELGGTL